MDNDTQMIKFGTTITARTREQIKHLAENLRWGINDVLEVAVNNLHNQAFGNPPVIPVPVLKDTTDILAQVTEIDDQMTQAMNLADHALRLSGQQG